MASTKLMMMHGVRGQMRPVRPAAWVLALAAGLLGGPAAAQTPDAAGKPAGPESLWLYVFVRDDSPACEAAVACARELAERRGGIRLEVRDVGRDEGALDQFWSLAERFKVKRPGLPAFYTFDQFKVGFADAKTSGPAIAGLFAIEAYVRSGCPHCRQARRFCDQLPARWPAVEIQYHDLDRDAAARGRMNDTARRYGRSASGLPVIEVCGRLIVGYQSDQSTGRQIEGLLRRAAQPLPAAGKPPPARDEGASTRGGPADFAALILLAWLAAADPAAEAPPARDRPARELPPVIDEAAADEAAGDEAEAVYVAPHNEQAPTGIQLPALGYLRVDEWGLPLFTFLVGLVDGFNPCAMWVLVFLLSVLVNVKSRLKMVAIAGTFVLVSGLAYFAFMAAWLNLFLLIGIARPLQIVLGIVAIFVGMVNVKDFFAFKRGLSLSIPEAARPGIAARVRSIVNARYLSAAMAAAVVLAVVVNLVELLCTAGLPALYTQILAGQGLPPWQNYAYVLLYNVAYMFDDTLLLGVVVATLSRRRLDEREGRWLKLTSGLVILALGIVMIARPEWLQFSAAV